MHTNVPSSSRVIAQFLWLALISGAACASDASEPSSGLRVRDDFLTDWALAGEPYVARLGYVDSPVTFQLISGPTGMELEHATGDIAWTPTLDDVGRHVIEVQVTQPEEERLVVWQVRVFGEPALAEAPISAATGGEVTAVLATTPVGEIRVTVAVPPGALAADATIGIHRVADDFPTDDVVMGHLLRSTGLDPSPSADSPIQFQLTPGGEQFVSPVALTLTVPKALLGPLDVLNGARIEHLTADPDDPLLRWIPEDATTEYETTEAGDFAVVRFELRSFSACKLAPSSLQADCSGAFTDAPQIECLVRRMQARQRLSGAKTVFVSRGFARWQGRGDSTGGWYNNNSDDDYYGYLYVVTDKPEQDLLSTAAHEFAHAQQEAHGYLDGYGVNATVTFREEYIAAYTQIIYVKERLESQGIRGPLTDLNLSSHTDPACGVLGLTAQECTRVWIYTQGAMGQERLKAYELEGMEVDISAATLAQYEEEARARLCPECDTVDSWRAGLPGGGHRAYRYLETLIFRDDAFATVPRVTEVPPELASSVEVARYPGGRWRIAEYVRAFWPAAEAGGEWTLIETKILQEGEIGEGTPETGPTLSDMPLTYAARSVVRLIPGEGFYGLDIKVQLELTCDEDRWPDPPGLPR